ncbi:MAG: hypothetical protein K1X89_14960 [Myxococcaceae bacterium]|nr:hypothetical protein [Myxococcaceae bacterium]
MKRHADTLALLVLSAVGAFAFAGATWNPVLLAACASAAVGFHLAARALHVERAWRFALALAYAFAPTLLLRSETHPLLAFTWHLPWVFVVARWLASRRGLDRRAFLTAALVTCTALQAREFACFALLLWTLALGQHLVRGPRHALRRAALLGWGLAVTLGVGLVRPAAPPPSDSPELAALKPSALLEPGATGPLGALGARLHRTTVVESEIPAPYLGALGALAFLWCVAFTALRVASGRLDHAARLGLSALTVLLAAGPGALPSLLAVASFDVLHFANRASSLVGAGVLLSAGLALSHHTRRWPASARLGLAFVLTVLAVLEQTATAAALL